MGQKGLVFLEGDGSKCLNQIFSSIGLWGGGGGEFNFLTPLIRNSGTPYVLKICTMFIYALQEESLLKCFKSYFEEKNLLLYTIFGWTLGRLAGRLHINRPEGKPTARYIIIISSLVRQKWFCAVRCIVLTAF